MGRFGRKNRGSTGIGVLAILLVTLGGVTAGVASTDPPPIHIGSSIVAAPEVDGMTLDSTLDVAASSVFRELEQVAADQGFVRVIVNLQMMWSPEPLLGEIERASQSSTIDAQQDAVVARLAGTDYRVNHRYDFVPYIALHLGEDAVTALENSGLAAAIQIDAADPVALGDSIPLINADDAWTDGYEGTGQVVAILDTGVDSSHPFVSGRVVEEACFSLNNNCPNASSIQFGAGAGVHCTYAGGCDHGTHVAGIATGFASPGDSGVARDAGIMAIQVFSRFDDPGNCGPNPTPCTLSYVSDQLAGLERIYALRGTHNFSSANMSIGGGRHFAACDSDSRKAAIDNLRSAGIATVISSGNSGYDDSTGAPGCISTAVTVASSTKADARSSFSNSAPWVDVIAPGSDIFSSVPGGGFAFKSGTSMAAPHVAGAWAVLKEAYPSASVSDITTAFQVTGPLIQVRTGPDEFLPRIDLTAAIDYLRPINDDFTFASATMLPLTATPSTEGATTETGEPLVCDDPDTGPSPIGSTIWYGFVADDDVPIEVDTAGSGFDTIVGVYTGATVDTLTQVACDDDGATSQASLTFMATSGVTYWVQVGGYGAPAEVGAVSLSVIADPGHLPPTWPSGSSVAFSNVLEDQAIATWTAAEDDLSVTSYAVLVDGVQYGTTSGTTYTISGLDPSTSYGVVIEARDGNSNATSGPTGSFTTAIDFLDTGGTVFEGDIAWLSGAAITAGCNPPVNNMFCPNDFVTRGQMAAFLVRALGLSDDGGGDLFDDDDGSIFEPSVDKLATAGITRGCNPPVNDMFCPNDFVTRGQMAAFLVRAVGYTDNGGGNLFTDDDGSVFEDAIDKLGTAGVTRGCNPPVNDRYCPDDRVTRGQMAAFLRRALG